MAVSTLPAQGGIASTPAAGLPLAIDGTGCVSAILALDLGTTTGWAIDTHGGVR